MIQVLLLRLPDRSARTLRQCPFAPHRLAARQWDILKVLGPWALPVVVEGRPLWACRLVDLAVLHLQERMARLRQGIMGGRRPLWAADTLLQVLRDPDSHGPCPQADSPRPARTRPLLAVTDSSRRRRTDGRTHDTDSSGFLFRFFVSLPSGFWVNWDSSVLNAYVRHSAVHIAFVNCGLYLLSPCLFSLSEP